jgi:RNA:NAD 2'-phosphotransferase (TPT1/KptA family)
MPKLRCTTCRCTLLPYPLQGRYELDDSSSPPRIRAVQGHSITLGDPKLTPLASHEQVPVALHITSEASWLAIQHSGELRRMGRTHVHLATEPGHLRRNTWATVLLRVNLRQAMEVNRFLNPASQCVLWWCCWHVRCVSRLEIAACLRQAVLPAACVQDGHAFFTAANGVLLTEGPLPLQYVHRVERSELPDSWQ